MDDNPVFGGESGAESLSQQFRRTPSPAAPSWHGSEEAEEDESLGGLRPRGEKRPLYDEAGAMPPKKKTKPRPSLGSRVRDLAQKAVEADVAAVDAAANNKEKTLLQARLEKSRAALAAFTECPHWDKLAQ
ncbi:Hypothetical predicted protein [Lecanosticta acicola]|uniref:No apical meristem-associated C-terminal domain-containing protein n=1 Tax=Lecanosticta acicola TaxID=111012 RepID=A0AAI8Z6C3_9PEZI|nr:Hypothetical predicted protein [Lecanosticta acicola]